MDLEGVWMVAEGVFVEDLVVEILVHYQGKRLDRKDHIDLVQVAS